MCRGPYAELGLLAIRECRRIKAQRQAALAAAAASAKADEAEEKAEDRAPDTIKHTNEAYTPKADDSGSEREAVVCPIGHDVESGGVDLGGLSSPMSESSSKPIKADSHGSPNSPSASLSGTELPPLSCPHGAVHCRNRRRALWAVWFLLSPVPLWATLGLRNVEGRTGVVVYLLILAATALLYVFLDYFDYVNWVDEGEETASVTSSQPDSVSMPLPSLSAAIAGRPEESHNIQHRASARNVVLAAV